MLGKLSKKFTIASVLVTFMTGLLVPLLPTPVAAAPELPSTPNPNFPTFQSITNGRVNAVTVGSDGSTYVGGIFSRLDPTAVTNATRLDTSVGNVLPTAAPNNTVQAAIPDREGGWYIGGDFTQVGSTTRNRLAHILADGSIDPMFDPDVNDMVYALTLSADGSTLYAGGDFTTVNGSSSRPRFAAFNATTGVATSLGSTISGGAQYVNAIILSPDESLLYIGGYLPSPFNPGAQFRGGAAAIDIASDTLTSFNADIDIAPVTALQISSDGSTLYAAGHFSTIGSGAVTRNHVAAFDTATSSVTTFDPDVNGTAYALALSKDNSTLYVGGSFTTVNGGTSRRQVAAFDTATSSVTAFDRGSDGGGLVRSLILSQDEDTLYAGGSFSWGDFATQYYRSNIAALDSVSGSTMGYGPITDGGVYTLALSSNGSALYAGGSITNVEIARRNLVRILPDGSIDPILDTGNSSPITSLAVSNDNQQLYIGGEFTTFNDQSRNYIAAVDLNTGELTSFNPSLNAPPVVMQITSDNSTLYVGGYFTSIGGSTTRNHLAAFDTATGTLTSFDPNVSGSVTGLAVSPDSAMVYAAGVFFSVNGGTSRSTFAALDSATGLANDFSINPAGVVYNLALSPDGGTLYMGGSFSPFIIVPSVSRRSIAAMDTATGAITDFNPNVSGQVNALTISPDGSRLYAGGQFTTVNDGTTRNRLAAFDTTTGLATDFDPNMDNTVNALAFNNLQNSLYVGGVFTSPVNYAACFGECVYTPPVPPVPPMPPTPGGGGSGSGDLAPTGLDMRILYGLVILLIGGAAGAAYVSRRLPAK